MMSHRRWSSNRHVFVAVLLLFVCAAALPLFAQQPYRQPPQQILDVLRAPDIPSVIVSPTGDRVLLAERVRYPSIADVSEPMLRLAGLRINPATNDRHLPIQFANPVLKRIADGREIKIVLPPETAMGFPVWSADGRRFAFTLTTANAVQLWTGEAESGAVKQLKGVVLNAVYGSPFRWMPDSRTLLCRTIPARRGAPPERPAVPAGPNIQESSGRPAPVRTFQDLLQDGYDADLFDYYATSQLVLVDVQSGKMTPVGKPAIFDESEPAPDGRHILVARIHRPYSYLVTVRSFPADVEVWDRSGRVVYQLASLPLADNVPIGGVPTGPRSYEWLPTEPATLVWVEALDEGNPKKKVAHRDRVLWLKAPFTDPPAELARTEHRFAGLDWGERGDLGILRDFDRDRLRSRTWFFDPGPSTALRTSGKPAEMRLVWDRSIHDRYGDPGRPEQRTLPSGHRTVRQQGNSIFLTGAGASSEGDRPFLDRFNTKTLEAERIFHCDAQSYETVEALLTSDGSKFLTRYETPSDPPNYYVRTAGPAPGSGGAGRDAKSALTSFTDTTPELRKIKKELITYERADGVQLSFTLYLPPDYKPGERRPAVVWAYPREYTDPDLAGQVSGSPNHFVRINGPSHLFFLLAGYVVLDSATMPVVGDPETVNDTYVEQIVASAKAAVDKAAEMGVIDPDRVGVGGHSYGAFMTANLLAHSDVFRAGIARSGAYNRTLTPFGFQSERRTVWQATAMYVKVSPFLHADKINEPILLIHGEADNNSGTFPIQSERMYHALKGNGGTVRYVTLPHESHGYAARQSVEHTLWEMLNWFETHVKNAPPRGERAGATATNPKE